MSPMGHCAKVFRITTGNFLNYENAEECLIKFKATRNEFQNLTTTGTSVIKRSICEENYVNCFKIRCGKNRK